MVRTESPPINVRRPEALPRLWPWLLLPLVVSAWTREWWAPDEPRYAEVAREIARSGNWLVMHLCGEVYPNKPPLSFWLSSLCGELFGWSELSLRLPVLLATAASAWLIERLARRWFGETEALLAPAIYLSSAMVLWHGARLQIDPLLGALTLGALVLATETARDASSRARLVIAAGACTGLALLAKGPVALIFVGLPLLLWRRVDGRPEVPASRAATGAAIALSLLPGLAWAGAVTLRHPEIGYDLFVGQFFERALAGRNHVSPFWYHAGVQPLLLLPWTLPVLAGAVLGWRALRERRAGRPFDVGSARVFLWAWPLFLLFSASPEKRDLYLLPAYPAFALAGARWLATARLETASRKWIAASGPALLALAGLAVCFAPFVRERLPQELVDVSWQPAAVGIALIVGSALAGRFALRGRATDGALASAAGLGLAAAVAALAIFPRVNALKSPRHMAGYVQELGLAPRSIPCFGVMPEGFRFYSDLPFVPTPRGKREGTSAPHEAEFVARERDASGPFLALVAHSDWSRWSEATRAAVHVLYSDVVSGKHVLLVGDSPHP